MKLLIALLMTGVCWGQIITGGGGGGGGTVGPGTAGKFSLFTGTGNTVGDSNLAQDAASGALIPALGLLPETVAIAENGGAPVLDLTLANYYQLTLTGNDTMTLAATLPAG